MADPQPQAKSDTIVVTTTMGSITVVIFEKEAPSSAKNFLSYVDSGFYSGLIFHRVIPRFMIQVGGFLKNMTKRPPVLPPIKNESDNGLKNVRGTLAMARTMDPNSATSQFFINLVDNAALDFNARNPGYAVFGKVVEGMDVVDKIAQVKTSTVGQFQDVPAQPIIILSAKRK
ncbi:MAG: peptidylprolyl isomerase [Ignavibacteriales bacterium]|nr:peptidylprolyl isomerase [Ignavibacteriales bacterium]